METPDPKQAIRAKALELGFDAVGFARADQPLEADHARYEAFLEAGMHGEMAYLAENREARARLDGEEILAGARSVVCVARSYAREVADEAPRGSVAAGVARYARGHDYHTGVRKRLRRLAAFVRSLGEGVEARPMIDTAPVLERAWAARAGLGFVGKNGMIIVPGQGSFLLLGEVVTTLELPADVPLAERCGACTRCLDACPTQAFQEPFVLDARRCISYLTIELRGEIPAKLREGVGEHLFGCDVCQDVCPFNRTRPPAAEHTETFAPLERWRTLRPIELLSLTEERFHALAEGSPLRRAGRAGVVRNAITAVVAAGQTAAAGALRRLAADDPDDGVRSHAAWGAERLGGEAGGGGGR